MTGPGGSGQLGQHGARERIARDVEAGSAAGREGLLVFLVAVVTFLLVASASVRQATNRDRATVVLENVVASTTEIDMVLVEDLADARRTAQSGRTALVALPGYPIDVYFTREEAATLDEPAIRELVLRRSASLVYDEGLRAFDRTGQQEFGVFSIQGLLDLLVDRLTADTHDRAGWGVALLAVAGAALAAAVLLLAEGCSGFSKLGIAVVTGSGFGFLVSGLCWLAAGWIGTDDQFVADLQDIMRTLLAIPLRNNLVVMLGGSIVVAAGLVTGYVARAAGLYLEDPLPAVRQPDGRGG